ncbi:hypothetical protein DTK66_10200 [Lactobacillus sp. M31]|uniref:Reverse transcriptase domain-containing protein n=2 Tax=Limosilactobacillus walteri TaxID=2268022 RepID=A0ABR8P9T1_9LACO|nr:hypothetical protein [Limosilactobacillus walteri]
MFLSLKNLIEEETMDDNTVKILDLDAKKAREAFLLSKNYFNCNLPEYFDFTLVLKEIDKVLRKKNKQPDTLLGTLNGKYGIKKDCLDEQLKKSEDIHINLYLNKNGEYDWRKLQIVNPYLYVSLVHLITQKDNWSKIQDRFKAFDDECGSEIICTSIPFIKKDGSNAESKDEGINWWKYFEQESLKMGLFYKYCVQTDLVNCYGAIYTHTIAWALEGKDEAKENRGEGALLGNKIDSTIQRMQNGQTNGIPQGSKVFDLIAELVLRYSDSKLIKKLHAENIKRSFKILRYRDDYRIFANNKETLDKIVKELSFISAELNMHFNNTKTRLSTDVISSSIKPDKMYWVDYESLMESSEISDQKKLLMIYKLTMKFPNTGSVKKALIAFRKLLRRKYNIILEYYSYAYIFSIFKAANPLAAAQNIFGEIVNEKNQNYEVGDLFQLCNSINSRFGQIETFEVEKLRRKLKSCISKNRDSNNQLSLRIVNELLIGNISFIQALFKKTFYSISELKNSFERYFGNDDNNKFIQEEFETLINKQQNDYHQLAAILTMIGVRSPKHIDTVVSCLSVLCDTLNDKKDKEIFIGEDMRTFNKRLKNMPNSEYMQLWMQRFFLGNSVLEKSTDSGNKLLNAVSQMGTGYEFWNMKWLNEIDKDNKLRVEASIINKQKLEEVESIIKINEEDEYE